MKQNQTMKFMLGCTFVLLSMLISCASKPQLYEWNSYNKATYSYEKTTNDKSRAAMKKMYEQLIQNPNGTRNVVAPGIYADYAFLLLQEGEKNEALAAFNKEMNYYPESALYLLTIVKEIQQ